MSYSSHKVDGLAATILCTFAVGVAVTVPVRQAFAADTYVQPQIELGAVSSSNFNLDPVTNDKSDTYGAIADLAALFGIATPRSETTLRPRVRLQSFSDRPDLDKYEAFLDVKSGYQSERSEFNFLGRYSRLNAINAALADAGFGNGDPNDPTTPETGSRQIGETRQRLDLSPNFSYRVSERASVGGEVVYQGVRYSSEAPLSQVDYDFLEGAGFVQWAFTARSDLTATAYASNYDARQELNRTDTVGTSLGVSHRWSERTATEFEVTYEQNDMTIGPVPVKERSNDWGVGFSTYMKGDVDQWRVAAGRSYTPNGRGGKSAFDQFRVQYDRDLSERLHFMGAARYVKDKSISQVRSIGDREYSRLELSLTRFVSPKWFVRGGYQYTYQDKTGEPEAADDNRIMLSIGYQGLGRASQ